MWYCFDHLSCTKYSVILVAYADFIVFSRYIYSCVTHVDDGTTWAKIIGLNAVGYDPHEVIYVWAYSPSIASWIVCVFAFILHRRT